MTFQVGQKVVCISDASGAMHKYPDSKWPKKDRIYTIATINDWPWGTLLTFEEIDNRHYIGRVVNGIHCTMEPGFGAKHFRPIVERKTDITVFTDILRKATKPARSPAMSLHQR